MSNDLDSILEVKSLIKLEQKIILNDTISSFIKLQRFIDVILRSKEYLSSETVKIKIYPNNKCILYIYNCIERLLLFGIKLNPFEIYTPWQFIYNTVKIKYNKLIWNIVETIHNNDELNHNGKLKLFLKESFYCKQLIKFLRLILLDNYNMIFNYYWEFSVFYDSNKTKNLLDKLDALFDEILDNEMIHFKSPKKLDKKLMIKLNNLDIFIFNPFYIPVWKITSDKGICIYT